MSHTAFSHIVISDCTIILDKRPYTYLHAMRRPKARKEAAQTAGTYCICLHRHLHVARDGIYLPRHHDDWARTIVASGGALREVTAPGLDVRLVPRDVREIELIAHVSRIADVGKARA